MTGPALQILIGPSREMINTLKPLAIEVAAPFSALALIDTGSHTTVLNPATVSKLGIQPVGVASIFTPSTTAPVVCNRYHVNLYLPDDFVVENVFALEAPMGGVPYQCLLGRDVLRRATFVYDGASDQYTLTF